MRSGKGALTALVINEENIRNAMNKFMEGRDKLLESPQPGTVLSAPSRHRERGKGREGEGSDKLPESQAVSITFTKPGPIGLQFDSTSDGKVIVRGIKPGGPASGFPQIKTDMILSEVADQPIEDMSFDNVMDKIYTDSQSTTTPLKMKFEYPKNLDGGGKKKTRRNKTKRKRKTRGKKIKKKKKIFKKRKSKKKK